MAGEKRTPAAPTTKAEMFYYTVRVYGFLVGVANLIVGVMGINLGVQNNRKRNAETHRGCQGAGMEMIVLSLWLSFFGLLTAMVRSIFK
jgi:hypothetical protein